MGERRKKPGHEPPAAAFPPAVTKDRRNADATDKELLALSRDDDEAAQTLLYRKYEAYVRKVAFRFIQDPQSVEEVVQDTFASLFQSLAGFRGEALFTTYLYRFAMNSALGRVQYERAARRSGRRSEERLGDRQDDLPAHRGGAPDARLLDREFGEAFRAAVRELPWRYRFVFIQRDIMERSSSAVAEILGITATACNVRLFRARGMLRERLAPHDGKELLAFDRTEFLTPALVQELSRLAEPQGDEEDRAPQEKKEGKDQDMQRVDEGPGQAGDRDRDRGEEGEP